MKFLKSTVAIVALFTIGSVSAKVMKKTQPTIQPMPAEAAIKNYIDQIFVDNYDDLADMLLTNHNAYTSKEISDFIQQLAGFIVNEFPAHIITAKRLFKEEMMGFCDSIKNDHARIMFIQGCIDNSMQTARGTRQEKRTTRNNQKFIKRNVQ